MDICKSYDNNDYRRFTFPQEMDKAIHTLEGIVKGIAIDKKIVPLEITSLKDWCAQYRVAASKHPFNELLPRLDTYLQDGILDSNEKADILWLCSRITTPNEYFNVVTSDIQRLHGMLIGISADRMITTEELDGLLRWMQEHENLKTTWPYDEIDSVVTSTLADGKIDEHEHRFLLEFCDEFMRKTPNLLLESEIDENLIRHGVCAMCPKIEFRNKCFCFSGGSVKASKNELANIVHNLEGSVSSSVTRKVDYLIVGGEGNKTWAFSCYGRKVEEAMSLRKQGFSIQIVHEFDFWDAVAEH